jgi:hypothetical protein
MNRDFFAPCLNEEFTITTPIGPLVTKLVEARSLAPTGLEGARTPFSLIFQGPPQSRLPQQIYPLAHPRLGALEIFLVQVAGDHTGSLFEAVFN